MGVAAIQEFMAKDFVANPKRTIEWRTGRVEVAAAGDIGVEYGTYSINNAGLQGTDENHGSYVTVYRKVNGDWKVAVDAPVSALP